jgi:hypothetical protein
VSNRDIEVDVTDEEIALMTELGFWKQDADGVLVLTAEGNRWVSEWCKKKIAEAA